MADTQLRTGTTSLELSAKGAGSDVRSCAEDRVGEEGARLFINNIAEPGIVDTIINLHRGEVGIGTSRPSAKLTVETGRLGPVVLVHNTASNGDGIRSLAAGGHGVSGASVTHTGTEGASESGAGLHGLSSSGPGVRAESNSGPAVVASTIQGLNVIEGRRISQLVFAVTSAGNVLADGSFGGPADFAEMLPVAGTESDYEPGDVLVIGLDGKLTRADEPSATAVAGVYSSRPGFVGDSRRGDGGLEGLDDARERLGGTWLSVALMGVVPVKADAGHGAIHPGDLLTTSETPGHAMRAEPVMVDGSPIYPTGAILGKALQPLASGTARIDVLLMLQ